MGGGINNGPTGRILIFYLGREPQNRNLFGHEKGDEKKFLYQLGSRGKRDVPFLLFLI